MATPIYKGKAQPAADSGWLTGLGSWFGGAAPAYAGRRQAAQGSSGYFGGTTPAYKPAPTSTDGAVSAYKPTPTSTDGTASAPDAVAADVVTECPDEPARITVLIPRELIEPQQ